MHRMFLTLGNGKGETLGRSRHQKIAIDELQFRKEGTEVEGEKVTNKSKIKLRTYLLCGELA